MKYPAVFFDFDYTLGDATDSIVAGFNAGMSALGQPLPTREQVRHTVGLPLEDAYAGLTGDLDPQHAQQFKAAFAAVARPMQAQGVPLFPGAVELLHHLREEEILLAIVSTKQSAVLEHILQVHGLRDCFSLVLGGDRVQRPKPDPEGVLFGLAQLGLSPKQLLYCGDTTIDAKTAQAAGCDFAAVLNGTTSEAEFLSLPHVCIAPDLFALNRFLFLAS